MEQDERKKLKDTIDQLTLQLDKLSAPKNNFRNDIVNQCIDIVVAYQGPSTELVGLLKELKKVELL